MISTKKIITFVVIMCVVLAAVWFVSQTLKKQSTPIQTISEEETQASNSQTPKREQHFVTGKIISASATEIIFNTGEKNYQAQITSKTKITKIAGGKNEMPVSMDADVTDLVAGKSIVIIFDSPADDHLSKNVYSGVINIQLIN